MINFSSQKPKAFPIISIGILVVSTLAIFIVELSGLDVFLIDQFTIKTENYFSVIGSNPLESVRLVLSLFLHGNWLHWIVNSMVFLLLAFSIERIIGSSKFLLVFLLTGIVGNLFASLLLLNQDRLLMGSSGAVSGLIGLWLVLFPNKKIDFIIPIGLYMQRASMPIAVIILGWLSTQLLLQFQQSLLHEIAWISHIMGFTTGFLLAWFVK